MKLLIFGNAAQSHWKLQPGFVVAVTNADITDENNGNGSTFVNKHVTLKIMKAIQIISLGVCANYGICSVCLITHI